MRVVAFLFASAIAVSSATAITQDSNTAELLKRCNEPGEACYQVKRAASAAALALARPDATSCGDNAECHLVKRTNEELLKELTDIAHDYNPEDPEITKRDPFCGWRGNCAVKREAEPEAEPWCRWKGQPCSKKREAEPLPIADPWCRWKGQPCSKAKREAEPWCRWKGQPCSKLKRAADAVADAAAEPEPEAWCRWKGQPCSKAKREAEPWCRWKGQPCSKAKRDLEALNGYIATIGGELLVTDDKLVVTDED
ncbi:putative pheromone precursor protein 1 protein [Neofusicoccum parvum UCRNP2]|uniref:Putative pheromone protein 1 protein n=1 Tax=Botryosphaeria parva (strain UCR-NP2) TaxID=1287680 RepID=R1EM09_BOTPV|nr:putative pheromone precursor protein 1 protein [Neofusicoccum parvum UCRNP2]